MTGTIAPPINFQGYTSSGAVNAYGTVATYAAGTSTPLATYTDATLTTANQNPLTLNAIGQAAIWLTPGVAYKFVEFDQYGNQCGYADQIAGALSPNANLIPSVTNTYNIGSPSSTWANGYFGTAVYIGGVAVPVTQAAIGAILYPQTATESALGVTPTNYVYPPGDPKRYGATANGTGNDQPYIQTAISVASASGGGNRVQLFCQGEKRVFNITTAINATGLSGIFFDCGGKHGNVTIQANTGNTGIDMTGSNWCVWDGLYLLSPSGVGTNGAYMGVFLAASTTAACQYNVFRDTIVQLSSINSVGTTAPALYGTIGFVIIGAEENTWIASASYANCCYFGATNTTQLTGYTFTGYQTITANHSCGVNTWAGECTAVTWDSYAPVFVLAGCNSWDFGNHYVANQLLVSAGSAYKAISIIGGTLEGMRGNIKIESVNCLISIDGPGAQLYGWEFTCRPGAGITTTNGWVEINPGVSTIFSGNINSFRLGIWYDNPASPTGKPYFLDNGGTLNGGSTVGSFSNIFVESNQTYAQFTNSSPPFPAALCGVVNSLTMNFVDVNYWINAHTQRKTLKSSLVLGLGNTATGAVIGTIVWPPIVTNFAARSMQVRVTGHLSNVIEANGGSDTNIVMCPIDTQRGAYETNTGASIVVGNSGGSSDQLVSSTTASALSTNAGLFSYTGANLIFNVASRTFTLNLAPIGTGTSLSSIDACANDLVIEMKTSGRVNDLIYLT